MHYEPVHARPSAQAGSTDVVLAIVAVVAGLIGLGLTFEVDLVRAVVCAVTALPQACLP
jgi:hypothetical protein